MSHKATRSRKRRKRRRTIPFIFDHPRLEALLWRLLDDPDPTLRAYLYRVNNGIRLPPALCKCKPFAQLPERLRDRYGGGDFHIIIRRGSRMELSGIIGIATLD